MPDRHTTQSQDEVFAFLADPETHGGAEVTRVDTHGAAVFLAGDRVLKVKRAVKFPFLDYSTRDKRKAACEAELRVNKLFAPADLSRRSAHHPGSGRPSGDRRRRRDRSNGRSRCGDSTRSATLDHLAEAGKIDDRLADELARAVAAAHRAALPVEADPWIDALESYIGQNEQAFAEFPDLFPPDDAAQLIAEQPASLCKAAAAAAPAR